MGVIAAGMIAVTKVLNAVWLERARTRRLRMDCMKTKVTNLDLCLGMQLNMIVISLVCLFPAQRSLVIP